MVLPRHIKLAAQKKDDTEFSSDPEWGVDNKSDREKQLKDKMMEAEARNLKMIDPDNFLETDDSRVMAFAGKSSNQPKLVKLWKNDENPSLQEDTPSDKDNILAQAPGKLVHQPSVTKIIKGYQLINFIGEGSFGQVFLCIDIGTGREYAMKVQDKK